MVGRASLAHELLERGLLTDRVEVGILGSERAELLSPVDREPKVLDRFVLPAGEALAAREVVDRDCVLGMRFDRLARAVGSLGVLALLVEVVERHPDLPPGRLVGLPRGPAEGDDRRARLLGKGRPLDARARVDERPGGRVHLLAVELEPRPAALNEVELLLLLVVVLVVLVDDPVAGVAGSPSVDAEGRNAEVAPDGPRRAAVAHPELLDLLEMRN